MAEKKPQSQVQEVEVAEPGLEASSRRSSESPNNPFSDCNEASSMRSEAQSVDATKTGEQDVQEAESTAEAKKPPLPSHSPLAFANYPPLWTNTPRPRPSPQATSSSSGSSGRSQSGFSAATLSAVMSSGSKDEKAKKFEDNDPDNRHKYVKGKDTYTHGKINMWGRDVGGLGKPPSFSFRRQKGK